MSIRWGVLIAAFSASSALPAPSAAGDAAPATSPSDASSAAPLEFFLGIAWSHLNRPEPDLDAAERNAHSALALVPQWHCLRDILKRPRRPQRIRVWSSTRPTRITRLPPSPGPSR